MGPSTGSCGGVLEQVGRQRSALSLLGNRPRSVVRLATQIDYFPTRDRWYFQPFHRQQ